MTSITHYSGFTTEQKVKVSRKKFKTVYVKEVIVTQGESLRVGEHYIVLDNVIIPKSSIIEMHIGEIDY